MKNEEPSILKQLSKFQLNPMMNEYEKMKFLIILDPSPLSEISNMFLYLNFFSTKDHKKETQYPTVTTKK